MEITPASFAQVRAGRDGQRVTITEDVGGIARQLHEVSPLLRLQWNDRGEFFMVIEVNEAGDEHLVLTARECDQRIVDRVRRIADPSYDFLADIDQLDRRAERENDRRFAEQTGEVGERLAHALRKDLQYKGRVFLP